MRLLITAMVTQHETSTQVISVASLIVQTTWFHYADRVYTTTSIGSWPLEHTLTASVPNTAHPFQ
jgi:hypothetical protein